MKTSVCRVFAAATLLLIPALAAHAGEIFTPVLPGSAAVFQQCEIINATASPQMVTLQKFEPSGLPYSSLYTATVGPDQSWGVSGPGLASGLYCKFTVPGLTTGFRASIALLDSTVTPPLIVLALPGY